MSHRTECGPPASVCKDTPTREDPNVQQQAQAPGPCAHSLLAVAGPASAATTDAPIRRGDDELRVGIDDEFIDRVATGLKFDSEASSASPGKNANTSFSGDAYINEMGIRLGSNDKLEAPLSFGLSFEHVDF